MVATRNFSSLALGLATTLACLSFPLTMAATAHDSASCPAPVFANDFNDDPVGAYVGLDKWNAPSWNNGIDDGRVEVIQGSGDGAGRWLRVHYPAGGVGPGAGGAQWKLTFNQAYDSLYLGYRVRFAPGFDFVLGGKLPGLVGGSAPSGCQHDPGGFSARGMWRAGGKAVQYLYGPHNVEACGDDYGYVIEGRPFTFEPGRWYQVTHHVQMNTPGTADGLLQAWVDGEQVLGIHDFLYRTADLEFGIDAMYFSTFFGGNSPEWAPTRDEFIDFDDFVVCEYTQTPDALKETPSHADQPR